MQFFPTQSAAELKKWRKDNPALAAKQDQEMAAAMSRLKAASLKKYGKQANGCLRIDPKMFLESLEADV